jgi:predicted Zn-dependent protease with MMP-like domain
MQRSMAGQAGSTGAPSAAEIEAVARAAMERLPPQFRAYLGDVMLSVAEVADPETLAALGIGNPLRLSGLYHGRPVGEKSSMDSGALPDRIHLYRQSLLAEWRATGVDLDALIEHVLVHEVGHHFGLSDADMHELEDEPEDSSA